MKLHKKVNYKIEFISDKGSSRLNEDAFSINKRDHIFAVFDDASIRKLKGRSAFVDERSRLEIVGSLRFVNRAVLGDRIRKWNDIYKVVLRMHPDFLVFGYDQKVDRGYLEKFISKNKLKCRIVRLGAYRATRYKSSKLKKLMGLVN